MDFMDFMDRRDDEPYSFQRAAQAGLPPSGDCLLHSVDAVDSPLFPLEMAGVVAL